MADAPPPAADKSQRMTIHLTDAERRAQIRAAKKAGIAWEAWARKTLNTAAKNESPD
jgi:predicted HicB family RNase H-like nuclease